MLRFGWDGRRVQNLSNKILLNAVKEFSPLKLRIGGSLQDKVIYGVDPQQPCTPFVKKKSEMFGFSQGCLPMHRWDELNGFFKKAGAVIIFGLNALNGRVHLPGGSLGGPWNSTNAASFIHYTVNKGYTIHGWELGFKHRRMATSIGSQDPKEPRPVRILSRSITLLVWCLGSWVFVQIPIFKGYSCKI
ncbi:heparanase-like protein 3 isoform X1 [Phoenix dactylifera]|uniref:Heparanase-like protein 3 isoform X1 n=1 Tax=Phoenix dactylifera TaxID=42345 RepID=A0A8B8ZF50_PHODC|nr:heparanase-like protein 3 isoform X1 [Phoenix dactylifera]